MSAPGRAASTTLERGAGGGHLNGGEGGRWVGTRMEERGVGGGAPGRISEDAPFRLRGLRQASTTFYPTVYELNGFRKSTTPQNRQLIVLISNSQP